MDIRRRLLLAFTPLFILLLGIAIALPFGQAQARDVLTSQIAAADELSSVQALELNVLLERRAVTEVASGDLNPTSVRLAALRSRVNELLAVHMSHSRPSTGLDADISDQYRRLSARYDEAIAKAAAGYPMQAQIILADAETNQLLDSLLSVSQENRDAARAEIDRVNNRSLEIQQRAFLIVAGTIVVGVLVAIGLTWLLMLQVVRPLDRLAGDAERYTGDALGGQLSAVGSILQLRRLRDAFQNLIDANAARQRRIQSALDELGQRVEREERLRDTVQALSVPVVPLQHDALLLPLVGSFDERRRSDLIRDLLAAIQRRRAQRVLLDITGLADLDPPTIAALGQAAESARLLGCSVYLIGVRASQALALATSDSLPSGITVARDVPSVLAQIGRP